MYDLILDYYTHRIELNKYELFAYYMLQNGSIFVEKIGYQFDMYCFLAYIVG